MKIEVNKRIIKLIIVLSCLIAFLAILRLVLEKEILQFDISCYEFLRTHLIKERVTPIAKIITKFGGAIIPITIAVLSLIFIKDKKIGFSIAFNLIIVTLLNLCIKNIVQRPRPDIYRLIDEKGFSFPSGHSMLSVAYYGLIIYYIHQKIQNKKIKVFLISIICGLIFLIGLSRVYLGVHYLSDVIGGAIFSVAYLMVYICFINRLSFDEEIKLSLSRKRKIIIKIKKITNSFKYAFEGLISSFKTERNMKIHILMMILVIIFGFILKISIVEWIICIILFGIVIGAELFNTAIETVVDMVTPYKNPKAKLAKDVSAGAVLVIAISSAIAGLIIFLPKIFENYI